MWLIRSFLLLFFAAGVFLIALAVRNALKGTASKRWPQVPGRILRSFVLVDKDSEGGQAFTAQVEFEYVVEGRTLRGMRLQYGRIGSWNRRRAERLLAPYQAGQSVPVYFDPRKPADSALVPGIAWGNAVIACAGVVFLAFAYLSLLDLK